jgi:hypothetical protein
MPVMPLGVLGVPEGIANAAYFLTSTGFGYITGIYCLLTVVIQLDFNYGITKNLALVWAK